MQNLLNNKILISIFILIFTTIQVHSETLTCENLFETAAIQKSEDNGFNHIQQELRSSNLVYMYEFENDRPNKVLSLEPNHSYTAIVHDGYLILGNNFKGIGGTMSGTHVALFNKIMGTQGINLGYKGNGGSIFVHTDGSIDISGYHIKTKSLDAAYKIAGVLMQAAPELRVRITEGKLSALEPF